MSNYIMKVDFFGNIVRCETDGLLVSLNDLVSAGNKWRVMADLPILTLAQVQRTQPYENFLRATEKEWGIERDKLVQVKGKGRGARTMAHVSVAVYIAMEISPEFQAKVIREFIEGKLLEFRELGGTEFKNLNAAIDLYLPGRDDKDNRGIYINAAKLLRKRILGTDSDNQGWATASTHEVHARYDLENKLVSMLRVGVIRDWEHLKEIIERL